MSDTMRKTIDVLGSTHTSGRALYESDQEAWVQQQVAALQEGRVEDLDRDVLIEVLTEMSKAERRELRNHLIVLLAHMLKCKYQPSHLSRSWRNTIDEQQDRIKDLLADSPSLKNHIPEILTAAYTRAVKEAARQTTLPVATFPSVCPWSFDEALVFVP